MADFVRMDRLRAQRYFKRLLAKRTEGLSDPDKLKKIRAEVRQATKKIFGETVFPE